MPFIEKEAKDVTRCAFPRRFTASARAAMAHILRVKQAHGAQGILLPAYIGLSKTEGSGVFDPVRQAGIPYSFYRLDERLVPDIGDLELQLQTGRFQLVFLIHYFGCAQIDVDALARLCRPYGAQLIEDCAHTLMGGLGGRRLGTSADYAIFSIHKSTATRDGGFYYDHHGDLSTLPLADELQIAQDTLEQFARIDVRALSEARAANYDVVEGWVRELPELELFFPGRPEHAVPLNCPVIVADGRREPLYFRLVEHGVLPTALYHRLIPEITRAEHPGAHHLAANILNLPTHPDITKDNHAKYHAILRQCVQEVFRRAPPGNS